MIITNKNNVFHLQTEKTSYIFRVLESGHLENLYYGKKIVKEEYKDGLKFNNKVYAVGEYLLSQTVKLSAIVNPLDADATKYAYKLVDTKGNAPLVVSGCLQNINQILYI